MININTEDRERCIRDIPFLKEVLEKEMKRARDHLEVAGPEKVQWAQGRANGIRDILNLLRRA